MSERPRKTKSSPRTRTASKQRLKLFRAWLEQHNETLSTWATSGLLHLFAVFVLALIAIPAEISSEVLSLFSSQTTSSDDIVPIDLKVIVEPTMAPEADEADATLAAMAGAVPGWDAPELSADDSAFDRRGNSSGGLTVKAGNFGGRNKSARQEAVKRFGATVESEAAVERGLQWLATVQQRDGGWSFASVGQAGSPGTLGNCRTGATAMALLAFLGAGHTHTAEGPWQNQVARGMKFLSDSAVVNKNRADLRGSVTRNEGMYAHGLASIALCEASAMAPTDRTLSVLAQQSINFIDFAQDKRGGGWRYFPGQAGDTSVVGWQVMAMVSARSGELVVPSVTFRRARRFLNFVQADDGAQYGYRSPQTGRATTTAVGLLCRMYLGWGKDHDALRRGVNLLVRQGPSRDDAYYNYYAAQVLHHYGGRPWELWNAPTRDWLVQTQIRNGPGAGSWTPAGRHGDRGGRIYQTTLNIMTLEVYYRHMPLYRAEALESTAANLD